MFYDEQGRSLCTEGDLPANLLAHAPAWRAVGGRREASGWRLIERLREVEAKNRHAFPEVELMRAGALSPGIEDE